MMQRYKKVRYFTNFLLTFFRKKIKNTQTFVRVLIRFADYNITNHMSQEFQLLLLAHHNVYILFPHFLFRHRYDFLYL